MANKLFKHLGFTSKKVSNQSSPSHEYSSTKNAGSFQELLSKSPTKNRSVVVDSPGSISSNTARPDFDGRRHSDAASVRSSLPGRGRNKSTPPGATTDWSLSRGARPKDQRYASCRVPAAAGNESVSGLNQTRSRRQQPQSGGASQIDITLKSPLQGAEITKSPQNVSSTSSSNGLSTQIWDEYSDPFDLKKVIEQNENVGETDLGEPAVNVLHDSATEIDQPLKCEDDYSVPYEIKERLRENELEDKKTEAINVPMYDDPYAEGPALSHSSPTENGNTNSMAISDHQCDVISNEESSSSCIQISDCVDNIIQPSLVDFDGGATYDEPWDLRAARIGLENRLRAVHSTPDQLASMSCPDHSPLTDPRPSLEYDEPWDRRVKDVQRNLISAKTAKEEARAQREGGFHSPMVPGSVRLTNESTRQRTVVTDPRNIPSLSKRGVDPCCWSYRSTALTGQMPKHKCVQEAREMPTVYRPVAERIDPKVPLQQQGWYHGSISRVDAETLLRIHREGSYLVRMSESNRIDYSLSFKSGRGFMHMKIVSTNSGGDSDADRHYILGQFSQPFDSIPQMIHHYTINKLPIKGAEHMSLLHPVNNELL